MPKLLHFLPAALARTLPWLLHLSLHDHPFMWQFPLTGFHPTSTMAASL